MSSSHPSEGSGARLTQQSADWFKDQVKRGAQNKAQTVTSTAWLTMIQQLKGNLSELYEGLSMPQNLGGSDDEKMRDLEERLAHLEEQMRVLSKGE